MIAGTVVSHVTFADSIREVGASVEGPYSFEPYESPFADYSEWLDFMNQSPDPNWRSDSVRRWVSVEQFQRCTDRENARIERFKYHSDGLEIRAFRALPPEADHPAPVVVFLHGGVGPWGRITFFDLLEMCRLAERGYAVLAPTLRGEGGSEGTADLGDGAVRDVLNLLRIVDEMQALDSARLALWGFSRGGGLVYQVLTQTDAIRAAVVVAGSTDSVNSPRHEEFHEHVYPKYLSGYAADPGAALKSISAVYWPEAIARDTPVLILHGVDDERVAVDQALRMALKLKEVGHPTFAMRLFVNGSHTLIEHQDAVRERIEGWLDVFTDSDEM